MTKQMTADEIFRAADAAHQQVRPGVCSCGREFFNRGRRSRQMWLNHRIYEEALLRPKNAAECERHAHDRRGACLLDVTDEETIALFKRMTARASRRGAKKAAE